MPLLLDGLRTQFAASDPNEVFADVTGAKPGEFRYVTGDGVVFSAIDSTNGHSYYQTLKASLDSLGATSKLTLLLSSSGGGQHTFASADYYTRGLWLAYDLDGPFTAYESSSSFKIGGFSALRAGSLVQGNVLPPGQTTVCTLITRDLTSSILTAAPDRTTGHRTTFTGSGAVDYVFPVNNGEWGLNADSELAIFRTIDGTVDACVDQIPQNSYIYFFHEDADNHNYAVYKANPRANTVLVVDVYYVSTVTEIYNSLTPGDSTRMLILPSQVNNLDDLTDVVVPNPSPGQSLVYDGANWRNQTPATGSDFFAHTYTYNSTQAPPTITDVGQWRYDETLDRFYLHADVSDGLYTLLDVQNVHIIKVYNKVDSTMYGYYRVSLTDSKQFVDLGGGVGYIMLNGVEELANTSIPNGRECQLIFDFRPNMTLSNIVGVVITPPETDGQVLTYDGGSGNWVNGAGGAGETITASNEGVGIGTPFIQRTADNLEFKTFSGSNGITITNNAETIDIAGPDSTAWYAHPFEYNSAQTVPTLGDNVARQFRYITATNTLYLFADLSQNLTTLMDTHNAVLIKFYTDFPLQFAYYRITAQSTVQFVDLTGGGVGYTTINFVDELAKDLSTGQMCQAILSFQPLMTFDELTDTDVNNPVVNQTLRWNPSSSVWENALKSIYDGFGPPNASNDSTQNYEVGSIWIDVSADKSYVCVDALAGDAKWKETSNQLTHTLEELTDTDLTPVDYVSPYDSISSIVPVPVTRYKNSTLSLVTTWADEFNGANTYVSSTNATMTTIGATAKPAVNLSVGVTDAIYRTQPVTSNTNGGFSYTVVIQDLNVSTSQTLFHMTTSLSPPGGHNGIVHSATDNYLTNFNNAGPTVSTTAYETESSGKVAVIHYQYRFSDTVVKSYINGVEIASGTSSAVVVSNMIYMFLGASYTGGGFGANLKIGEFIVWNTTLTPAQIQTNSNRLLDYFNKANGIPDRQLLLYDLPSGKWINSLKSNYNATTPPLGANDATENYTVGSRWLDVTNDREWVCVDATPTLAVWRETSKRVINDLEDVVITTPEHGQVLCYDKDTATFRNDTVVWNDLMGLIDFRTGGGANAPTVSAFRDTQVAYACQSGPSALTDFYLQFHTNHDNLTGSEWHLHVHHASNAAAETGQVKFVATVSYAAINGVFTADTTLAPFLHTYDGTQYKHVVTEIPMGVSGGGVNLVNTDLIPTDSMVLVRIRRDNADVADTVVTNASVFVFQVDIHYTATSKVGSYTRGPPFD